MKNRYAAPFQARNKTGWIIFSEDALFALLLPKKNQPQPKNTSLKNHPITKKLENYFKGQKVLFNAKIDFSGYSDFDRKVLEKCLKVPYGQKVSYKELAAMVGNPKARRAVGNALGKNRLPIIIPCHRIIKSNGGLGGFSSGLKIKQKLLETENNDG